MPVLQIQNSAREPRKRREGRGKSCPREIVGRKREGSWKRRGKCLNDIEQLPKSRGGIIHIGNSMPGGGKVIISNDLNARELRCTASQRRQDVETLRGCQIR